MVAYERAGWLGSRDLGYSNRDLDKPYEHFSPVTGMKVALIGRPGYIHRLVLPAVFSTS